MANETDQPAYRFMSGVGGLSDDGYLASVTQHQAGTEPLAAHFNNNTNICAAVLANVDYRLRHFDGLNSGSNADEGIFDTVSSAFSNMIELITDLKGTTNWYDTVDGTGRSNQELYDRDVMDDFTITNSLVLSGATLTLSGSNASLQVGDWVGSQTGTIFQRVRAGNISFEEVSLTKGTYNRSKSAIHGAGSEPDAILLSCKMLNATANDYTQDHLDSIVLDQSSYGEDLDTVNNFYITLYAHYDMRFTGTHQTTFNVSWLALWY